MRVRVVKCFIDKTRLGRHGSFRDVGTELECSDERGRELMSLGLAVDAAKPEAEEPAAEYEPEVETVEADASAAACAMAEPEDEPEADGLSPDELIATLKGMNIKQLRAFADKHDIAVFGNANQVRKAIATALKAEG